MTVGCHRKPFRGARFSEVLFDSVGGVPQPSKREACAAFRPCNRQGHANQFFTFDNPRLGASPRFAKKPDANAFRLISQIAKTE